MNDFTRILAMHDYRLAMLVVLFAIVAAMAIVLGLSQVSSAAGRRNAAQRASLDEERSMLRALIDNMPDFVYVKDLKSRFVVANRHVALVVGVKTPEDLLGRTDFDFFPKEFAGAFYEDEQNVIRSGQPLENREERAVDSAGNEIHILTTKVPVRDNQGKVIGIAGIGRDITARKKMESALREAEQNYHSIFDNAIVGIFQTLLAGGISNVNRAAAFMFGFGSPEEMVAALNADPGFLFTDAKHREEFYRLLHSVGTVQNFEHEALRKDGSKIWVSVSARAIRENGVVAGYEGMAVDITERKQLREQLLQAQKLESVGQLAAGIAHEINTPTQYIGDNLRFLKDAFRDLMSLLTSYERLQPASQGNALSGETAVEMATTVESDDAAYLIEEIPKAIDQALEGVTRVATLVTAMKEFSHPGGREKVPLDLNHAIGNTITVARNEWKYVADLETDLDPRLPPVSCLPGEFNQVILNLIVNAAHAIADRAQNGGPAKGKIRVQTRKCSHWAEVQIQDTGTGIPEAVRSRVFDPFFTTKEVGKGTGQGLAISRSVIVDKHGGTIHFQTEVGKGTTFIVRLPLDGEALAAEVVAA